MVTRKLLREPQDPDNKHETETMVLSPIGLHPASPNNPTENPPNPNFSSSIRSRELQSYQAPIFPNPRPNSDLLILTHSIHKQILRDRSVLLATRQPHLLPSTQPISPEARVSSCLPFELFLNGSEGIRERTPSLQSIWTLTPESRSLSVSSRRRTGATSLQRLLVSE